MAFLLAAVVARFGVGWNTIPPLVAAVSLVTLSVVDWRCGRLPDIITFPASIASLAAIGAASIATGRPAAKWAPTSGRDGRVPSLRLWPRRSATARLCGSPTSCDPAASASAT